MGDQGTSKSYKTYISYDYEWLIGGLTSWVKHNNEWMIKTLPYRMNENLEHLPYIKHITRFKNRQEYS